MSPCQAHDYSFHPFCDTADVSEHSLDEAGTSSPEATLAREHQNGSIGTLRWSTAVCPWNLLLPSFVPLRSRRERNLFCSLRVGGFCNESTSLTKNDKSVSFETRTNPKTMWWKWCGSKTRSIVSTNLSLSLAIIILNSILAFPITSLISCSFIDRSLLCVLKKSFAVWFWPVVQHSPWAFPFPGRSQSCGCLAIFKCAGHWIAGTHLASFGHGSHFWNDVTANIRMENEGRMADNWFRLHFICDGTNPCEKFWWIELSSWEPFFTSWTLSLNLFTTLRSDSRMEKENVESMQMTSKKTEHVKSFIASGQFPDGQAVLANDTNYAFKPKTFSALISKIFLMRLVRAAGKHEVKSLPWWTLHSHHPLRRDSNELLQK